MIEMVFVMLMIQNGSVIEYIPTQGISDCLSTRRVVTRSIGPEQQGMRVECKNMRVEMTEDMGRLKIKKIYEEAEE
jgi:hypothetical protein|tara:strand:+ start:249 stop:476 length:228 start_codon:yes stop_codon:yes gene_type:complete